MRPSAGIGVVEVQKLVFCVFFWSVRARRSSGIGVVEVQKLELFFLGRFLLSNWSLAIVSRFARLLSESRGRGFDPRLVRGSSGCKIGNFKYKSSTRSTQSQILSTKVVRGVHSRSSGCKSTNFHTTTSTRSTFPQLFLQNRKC